MIRDGRVAVNNRTITGMVAAIDPEKDRITVDGRVVQPKTKQTYLLLHKPAGVVTTCREQRQRKTVLDLLPGGERLFPAGRLDYDTEGLVLMTDDGELANRLIHPRYQIPKTYLVETAGLLTAEKAAMLESGVELEDGWTRPAEVQTEECGAEKSRFYLTIKEGRNRQIRRMCKALGLPVTYLCRTKMSFLNLDGLAPGEYRALEAWELEKLRLALWLEKE